LNDPRFVLHTRPGSGAAASRSGFTLIELLVVVTIIVLLLALLTPALDRAVYAAELAVCGSKQHAVAASVLTYALGNQRRYPVRYVLDGYRRPTLLAMTEYPTYPDDRRTLAEIFPLNPLLNDPLTRKIDLEGPDAKSEIYSTYAMWFGWRYKVSGRADQGMHKIGDRFTWLGDSFRVLVSDWDGFYNETPQQINTHPDRDGVMFDVAMQDQDLYGTPLTTGPTITTFSFWHSPGGVPRGPVDTNYAFDDGSVSRYDDVAIQEPDRMVRVPQQENNGTATWDAHLPKP
jgi:prepilin-type N-terminal cleavage/methylation domain-containing protein